MKPGEDYPAVTVVFLCHDGQGNYLLQNRQDQDEKDLWDCGTGTLDLGCTVVETLKKEVKEEYCTEVIDYQFLGYRDVLRENKGKQTHWLALCFKVQVDRDQVAIGEPDRASEINWFKLDKFPASLHSQLQPTIDQFRAKLEEG